MYADAKLIFRNGESQNDEGESIIIMYSVSLVLHKSQMYDVLNWNEITCSIVCLNVAKPTANCKLY